MGLVEIHYNYWIAIILMMTGFYTVITHGDLIKKILGIAVFQTSVLLLYISMGYVEGGKTPILVKGESLYVNPLPSVLMLTAIVVGVATLAVGLGIIVRIKEAYGTIQETEILAMDQEHHKNVEGDNL